MDFVKRQQLVRRITTGRLYGSVKYMHEMCNVLFIDPCFDILVEADWVYNNIYGKCKEEGGMTMDESYEILKRDGLWSDKLEDEIKQLQTNIKTLSSELPKLQFHKAKQRSIKKALEVSKDRLVELDSIKKQLWSSTIEYVSERSKQRFIIGKITRLNNIELLSNPNFLDILAVYYYRDSTIPESQIRELARTDPWRLYWTASKGTGNPLFPNSSVEMTDLQYALVFWTKVYDFAYESNNRPTDDIVGDDDKFDAWYNQESERLTNELRKASIEQGSGTSMGGVGGQEIFIPADAEGAKEIYAMNDMDAKIRLKQRQKALEEAGGTLEEQQLPDIKRDIKIEYNKMIRS
jgi:hypothetical protein